MEISTMVQPLLSAAPDLPWWTRILGIVAVGLAVAAVIVLMQTSHEPPRRFAWVVVVLVPIVGPLIYLIAQTFRSRRESGSSRGPAPDARE